MFPIPLYFQLIFLLEWGVPGEVSLWKQLQSENSKCWEVFTYSQWGSSHLSFPKLRNGIEHFCHEGVLCHVDVFYHGHVLYHATILYIFCRYVISCSYFFFFLLQHLMERSWYAVTETCLAFTVFRDDFSPKFVALFTVLLFLKSFHWLAEDRVDLVSEIYSLCCLCI